jgi:hypothetical protein
MSKNCKKILIWLSAAGAIFLILFSLAYFFGFSLIKNRLHDTIDEKISSFSKKIGFEISYENYDIGFFRNLTLHGLKIKSRSGDEDVLYASDIAISFSYLRAISGTIKPTFIEFRNLKVRMKNIMERNSDAALLLKKFRESVRLKPELRKEKIQELPYIVFDQAEISFNFLKDDKQPVTVSHVTGSFSGDEDQGYAADFKGELSQSGRTGFAANFTYVPETGELLYNLQLNQPLSLKNLSAGLPEVSFASVEGRYLKTSSLLEVKLSEPQIISGFAWETAEAKNRIRKHSFSMNLRAKEIGFRGFLRSFISYFKDQETKSLKKLLSLADIIVTDGELKVTADALPPDFLSFSNFNSFPPDQNASGMRGSHISFDTKAKGSKSGHGELEIKLGSDGSFRTGKISFSGKFLTDLAHLLHNRILDFDDSSLSLELWIEPAEDDISFEGKINGRNIAYYMKKICLVPLTNLNFESFFRGKFSMKNGQLKLFADPVIINPLMFSLDFGIENLDKNPKITVKIILPRQPCHNFIQAIPQVMLPRLEGMLLSGEANLEISSTIDFSNLNSLSVELKGDVSSCQVMTLGNLVDINMLRENFTFTAYRGTEEGEKSIVVGPGTKDYIKLGEIPFYVQQEALATEDMGFFKHEGFKLGLIKRAIILDLSKGKYVYGGSTISQQLVKNLFLTREKTLARKLEEAIITWHMEREIPKTRILELYLNVIEFGTKVYGIRAAADTYFGKEPRDLGILEGAFIMAAKPDPKYAYNIYKLKTFAQSEWWIKRMDDILKRLWNEMGVIDQETYESAAPYIPDFYYPEE